MASIVCPYCSQAFTQSLMNIPEKDRINVNRGEDKVDAGFKFYCLLCKQGILLCAHCYYVSKCTTRNVRYFMGGSGHLRRQVLYQGSSQQKLRCSHNHQI